MKRLLPALLAALVMAGLAGCMNAGSYRNENPMTVSAAYRQAL